MCVQEIPIRLRQPSAPRPHLIIPRLFAPREVDDPRRVRTPHAQLGKAAVKVIGRVQHNAPITADRVQRALIVKFAQGRVAEEVVQRFGADLGRLVGTAAGDALVEDADGDGVLGSERP